MSASSARPSRASLALLPLVGACLLSMGLGGDPTTLGLWAGGTLLFWTTLLPRLPSLRGGEVRVASHGLAAGAFWAAVAWRYSRIRIIGDYFDQASVLRGILLTALVCGLIALLAGWLLDRTARRAPAKTRRALAVVLGLEAIAAIACLWAVRGDAPTPSQRLRELPIIGHMAEGESEVTTPWRIVRLSDGTLVAPGRMSDGFDALAVEARDDDHVDALFPAGEGGYHRCNELYHQMGALDVRMFRFGDGREVMLATVAGALEAEDDIDFARGCAFDSRGMHWTITMNNVHHPVRTGVSMIAVVIAGLVVAALQILGAMGLLLRHRRLRRAIEGISDGEGRATLSTGMIVDVRAPAGPVLVQVVVKDGGTYRDGARPSARVLVAQSRETANAEMDLSTCIALVAAVGSLALALLPLIALLTTRNVVPF